MRLIIGALALQTLLPVVVLILWGWWANRVTVVVIVVDRCGRVGCQVHGQRPRQMRKKGRDPGVGGGRGGGGDETSSRGGGGGSLWAVLYPEILGAQTCIGQEGKLAG